MKTVRERIVEVQLRNEELNGNDICFEAVHDQTCPWEGLANCFCYPDLYFYHPADDGIFIVREGGKIERVLDS